MAVALTATPAFAGGPGHWSQLSSGTGVGVLSQPGVARIGSGLGVVWSQDANASTETLWYRSVSPSGSVGAARKVVDSWAGLIDDPKIVATGGGGSTAVFSGQRSTLTNAPYDGTRIYRADSSSPGGPWTLGAETSFPEYGSPYGSYGTGAVEAGGVIYASYPLNETLRIVGSNGHAATFTSNQCCIYHSSLARDTATGKVWAAYYQNGSSPSRMGTFAIQVLPTLGTPVQLPGSVTTNGFGSNASDPDQAVAMAAPSGGGVFVAYVMGYPTANRIRVQRVGGGHVDLKVSGPRHVALTTSGNRLWLAWHNGEKIFATRSNPGGTRFGPVREVRSPGISLSGLAAQGSTGRVDLVVDAQKGSNYQIFHTQLLPGLTLTLSKNKVSRGGKVVVKVTDAGTGLAGATVKLGKKRKTTNAKGTVKFKVKKSWDTGKYKVVAEHAGYAKDKAKLRVK